MLRRRRQVKLVNACSDNNWQRLSTFSCNEGPSGLLPRNMVNQRKIGVAWPDSRNEHNRQTLLFMLAP